MQYEHKAVGSVRSEDKVAVTGLIRSFFISIEFWNNLFFTVLGFELEDRYTFKNGSFQRWVDSMVLFWPTMMYRTNSQGKFSDVK